MSLGLLYLDEMKGFYKSKVMIVLWVGLPFLSFLLQFIQPDLEGLPVSSLVAIVISSIGGTLSSVMLSTSITSERNRNVYDLFLIRPVKRYEILLSKYLAVFTCLIIAALFSLGLGLLIDAFTIETPVSDLIQNNLESLSISLAGISISCSIGIFFGIRVNSIPVAAILSVYLGNQISMLIILPSIMIEGLDPLIYSGIVGISVTLITLIISIVVFNKKQI
jgi:ABC-2 type transport system permease protein